MRRNGSYRMCLNCGVAIYVTPGRVKAGRGIYCSKECMATDFKHYVGNQNPHFKGVEHTFVTKGQSRRLGYAFRYIWSEFRKAFTPEHIVKAEKVLGRRLRKGECIHHVDCDPLNNESGNLVICRTGYHHWLHWRMAELYAKEHFAKEVALA